MDNKQPKAPLDDWQRFALLLFAIGAIAVVVLVYMNVKAGISG